jgi:integrase
MSPNFKATADRYARRLATTHKQTTVKLHLQAIRTFLRFLEQRFPEITSFADIRRSPHIEAWLIALAERRPKYAASTRESYLRALIGFFRRIAEWGFEDAPRGPLLSYRDAPKLEALLPRALLPEDDRALLLELTKDTSIGAAALLLTRNTGLRIGETVGLMRDCLVKDTGGAVIRVPLGKLNSERVVPVDDDTAKLVERLRIDGDRRRRERRRDGERPVPDTLILGPRGRSMDPQLLRKSFTEIARRAGINERVWPHRLRHTFAISMIAGGMSLPALMKVLGHNNIRMTLRYVRLTDADVAAQFRKASQSRDEEYALARRSHPAKKIASRRQSSLAVIALLEEVEVRIAAAHADSADLRRRRTLARVLERTRRLLTVVEDVFREGADPGVD